MLNKGTTQNISKTISSASDEEQELLQSFLDGSNYAFSCIYKKYVNELFAYGLGLGFEKETLKDAIQEVFYKFYESKKHLKNVNNLKYYLLRMLKNHLLDIHRSKMDISDLVSHELTFSIKTTVLDDLITKEERFALQAKIDGLLKTLTHRQREAIYLRFIQEMEYEEIAKILEMTPQACRKLISRAVKRIRDEQIPLVLLLTLLRFRVI